jgi:metal-responsive CopG/Arc/MetJ family transcriptional regulator
METIQVVLDAELLKAANREAKKQKQNRSALIRTALQEHLHRLHMKELEEQERRGYLAKPQDPDEYVVWEKEAVWPED